MIAAFSPGSDFKRYYRGRMPRLAFVVIILMPLMYGALYLWAFWDPFGNVDKVPVAIVNLDKGSELNGDKIDAGPDVVKGLIESKQLDLRETSNEDAVNGLAHGTYFFTITIPEDFSASIASAASGDPRPAKLVFTYNDANNYLATVIGQDAAEQVVNQVTAQVGQQVFESAITGIKGALPKIKAAAAGVDELNSGVEKVSSGVDQLVGGLVTAKSGSATLAGAIDQVGSAIDRIVADAEAAVATSGLSSTELRQIVQRIQTNTNAAAKGLDAAAAAQNEAQKQLQDIIDDLNASGDPVQEGIAKRLAAVTATIEQSRISVTVGTAFDKVQADVSTLAKEFDNPNSRLNVILKSIESGGIQSDLSTVKSDANKLRNGADELAAGLVKLSAGANELNANMPKLAAGTGQLADGVDQGMKLIPQWDAPQQESFVKTLADPVRLKQVTNNEAKTFAYGFAPFFLGLALFVGGIIAWMLFTPLQARPLAQGLGSFRVVLASYAPTFFVGALQATILFLVVRFALGLDPVYAWGTYGFMLLMVAMFLAMIQMFNALLGPAVGRVLTLAFLMIMLTSAGGIYPVPTTTLPFQYIHWVDPMSYTVTALRQLILGGVDYRLGVAVAVTVGLTVLFVAISTLAARRNRQYNMDRLYPPVEV